MNPDTGRALWRLLHAYAHSRPDGPLSPAEQLAARAWLAAFETAVVEASAGLCPCAQHWGRIVAQTPPDLTSRAAFFWWTVDVHNQVNARLGKPHFVFA